MLVYGVEGDRNAASLVKDSKAYIEIAKFVQAYTTIIQNPNVFLSEVGEEPINTETDILSWKQLVKIMTTCDLGFDPVPNEKQLVSYYSYAKQIGSISKETKDLATVDDVAEAQKHYYNFIDEETEKANVMYNKQHEIAQNRMKEVEIIDANLKDMKLKNSICLASMMLSVFLFAFGFISLFFDNAFARFIGFTNQYVGAVILMIIGGVGFFFADRYFVKTKYEYFGYKKSTSSAVSRSERTSRDEKILRDKLAKYEEDLKIAKYELADKEKRFDVEKNIERLRERNRYYRMLRDSDAMGRRGRERHRMSLLDELDRSLNSGDDLFSLLGLGGRNVKRTRRPHTIQSEEELENLRNLTGETIDTSAKVRRGELSSGYKKLKEFINFDKIIHKVDEASSKFIDIFGGAAFNKKQKSNIQQIEVSQVNNQLNEQKKTENIENVIDKLKNNKQNQDVVMSKEEIEAIRETPLVELPTEQLQDKGTGQLLMDAFGSSGTLETLKDKDFTFDDVINASLHSNAIEENNENQKQTETQEVKTEENIRIEKETQTNEANEVKKQHDLEEEKRVQKELEEELNSRSL